MIDGFRLEFSDGTVFEATKDVDSVHRVEPLYPLDGLRNLQAIYNQYVNGGGQPGRSDSNMSGVFAGWGAGIHSIEVSFVQYEGSTDSWGSASDGDHALTKRDVFVRELTTNQADSNDPALLRVGEYEPSGLYDEIPVAIGEVRLPFQTTDDERSAFRGSFTAYDAVDLSQAVDAQSRRG